MADKLILPWEQRIRCGESGTGGEDLVISASRVPV